MIISNDVVGYGYKGFEVISHIDGDDVVLSYGGKSLRVKSVTARAVEANEAFRKEIEEAVIFLTTPKQEK